MVDLDRNRHSNSSRYLRPCADFLQKEALIIVLSNRFTGKENEENLYGLFSFSF